nr:hypothetical protein [uncultured Tolumonas sp.]
MKQILMILLLSILWVSPRLTYAEVWVIVNQHNQIDAMDKSEVTGLYLGRYQSFRDGSVAHPLDQDKDGSVYEAFYQRLTGKSVAYINAYWAQILFTGRAKPPKEILTEAELIKAVRQDRNAIGYVNAGASLPGVKVVLRL